MLNSMVIAPRDDINEACRDKTKARHTCKYPATTKAVGARKLDDGGILLFNASRRFPSQSRYQRNYTNFISLDKLDKRASKMYCIKETKID